MATVEQLLPLDTLKDSLRIERDDLDLDDLLQGQAAAAVGFIQEYTGRQWVPVEEEQLIPIPYIKGDPVFISRPSLDQSTVVVMVDRTPVTPSRIEYIGAVLSLYPPVGGWPEAPEDFQYLRVTYTRQGTDATFPLALRHAAIVVARALYDGVQDFRPTAAFRALADPYRTYN